MVTPEQAHALIEWEAPESLFKQHTRIDSRLRRAASRFGDIPTGLMQLVCRPIPHFAVIIKHS